MFGPGFNYNQTILKYNKVFGSLFTNIKLKRHDKQTREQFQIVPIDFAPKFRYIERDEKDPNIERPVSVQLPRMTYELLQLRYDSQRQINPLTKIVQFENGDPSIRFFPVPYSYTYKLYVYTKNLEDQYQIAEQILPYFSPKFSVTAELVDGSSCPVSIDILLNDVEMSDEYEGSFTSPNRRIVWSYLYTIPGWIMAPAPNANEGKVIRWINTSISEMNGDSDGYSNTYPVLEGTPLEEIEPTDPYTIKTEYVKPND